MSFNSSSAKPRKMVKHSNNLSVTADKLLSVFNHFAGLPLKGLMSIEAIYLFMVT